jgi:hypothetical protein
MGHGGKRVRAGRRSLSKLDRLLIGARADNETRTPGQQLRNPDLNYDDIADSRSALDLVVERKKLSADTQEHIDWLREELDGRRVVRAARRTLPEIFASIAADESKRRGIPVTPRQVERWCDEYRKTKQT